MIILQSQISDIDLDTLHLELSLPFIPSVFVTLDTLHLTFSLPTSPGIGLIQLDTLHLVLTPNSIPTPSPVVVALSTLSLSFTIRDFAYAEITGHALKDLLTSLIAKGKAPVTPGRFVDCDAMDIIDAFRAGTTLPDIPYDVDNMTSNLLNALVAGNGVPFEVPVIGTWCGTQTWPDPTVSVRNAFFRVKGTASYPNAFPSNYTIQMSTNYGISWSNHPTPTVGFTLDFSYAALVNTGDGVLLLHPTSNSGSVGVIYKAKDYGLSWIKVDRSDIITRRLTGIITGFNQGLEDSQTVFGFTKESSGTPLIIAKSVNRGYSWAVVLSMPTASQVGSMVMLSEDIILMTYTSGTRYISKSIDGGLTWNNKYTNALYIGAPLINMGGGIVLWVNTDTNTSSGTIARSTDYGETWTDVPVPVLGGYHTEGVSLGNGVALINQYNFCCGYRTDDYGLTWTKRVFESLSGYGYAIKFFNCGNGKVIARWGSTGGNVKYSISSDYGLTWTDVSPSPWDNNYYTVSEVFITK
jgi:hypothetical protein